jgi:carbonic anhydrase
MLTFTDEVIRDKVRKDLQQNVDHIAFLPFGDLEQSVRDDIKLLKDSPLVLDVPITGYVYEVESGKIVKIGDSQ